MPESLLQRGYKMKLHYIHCSQYKNMKKNNMFQHMLTQFNVEEGWNKVWKMHMATRDQTEQCLLSASQKDDLQ
jgi:hypothetical protein